MGIGVGAEDGLRVSMIVAILEVSTVAATCEETAETKMLDARVVETKDAYDVCESAVVVDVTTDKVV